MTARTTCQGPAAGSILACAEAATRSISRAGTTIRACPQCATSLARLGWSVVPLGRRPSPAPRSVNMTVRLTRAELDQLELIGGLRGQTAREVARDAIVAVTRAPTES